MKERTQRKLASCQIVKHTMFAVDSMFSAFNDISAAPMLISSNGCVHSYTGIYSLFENKNISFIKMEINRFCIFCNVIVKNTYKYFSINV